MKRYNTQLLWSSQNNIYINKFTKLSIVIKRIISTIKYDNVPISAWKYSSSKCKEYF